LWKLTTRVWNSPPVKSCSGSDSRIATLERKEMFRS
jgi:hypothetical protein